MSHVRLQKALAVLDLASAKQIKLRLTLKGHNCLVNGVDYDNKHIVSASDDHTLKVWSMSTGKCLRTLQGHSRGVMCVQLSDGLAVSGSGDNTIRIWKVDTCDCVRVLQGHNNSVMCVKFD